MTLVLDATPAGPSANAYCTADEADAYHDARGFNPEWTGATSGPKEQALVWATRQLDQLDWKGTKRHPLPGNQALRWPRAGIIDRDFVRVDPDSIPSWLKNATAEWAFNLLKEDRTSDAGGIVTYGGKVGPISESSRIERNPVPASVLEIISPYLLYGGGNGCELVRA